MAEMKISNTLVNDTAQQVIAYARQLKDENFNGTGQGELQSVINQKLRTLRQEFDTLIGKEGDVDKVINTFKEVEDFLREQVEGSTLNEVIENFLRPIRASVMAVSPITIDLNKKTGKLTASYNTDNAVISDKSRVNPKTGMIELVFNF